MVVLVPLLTREPLPRVKTPPARIPDLVTLPRSAGGGGMVRPPAPLRPPRAAPPRSTVFVPSLLPMPEDESLDVPATESTERVDGPPCLIGCDPGGVPGGGPGDGIVGTGVAPAAPPAPIRTGGDIRPPLKVRNVVPPYPEVARVAHVQGDVALDCTISSEGRVVDVKILSGPILLQAAAVDAVRQWLYRPTLLNGVPVPVVMTVTVHFALDPRR